MEKDLERTRGVRAEHNEGETGGGEPDVLLDVPRLKVDEIELEVDNLRARVALHAAVAQLVTLDVGADVEVERVKLEIEGVEAAALLKVRLEHVYRILERTLTTLDNNPEILQSLLEPLGETVGAVGRTAEKTLPQVGESLGKTVEETAPQVGESVGKTAEKTAEEAVPALGKSVGKTAEEAVPAAGEGVAKAAEEVEGAVGQVGEATHDRARGRKQMDQEQVDRRDEGSGRGQRTGGMESAKRLIDDLSAVLDGFRQVVEARIGEQREQTEEGTEGEGEKHGVKDLRQLVDKLGNVQSDLGGIVEDLRKSLEKGVSKAEEGLRSALYEAAQFVQRHTEPDGEKKEASEGGDQAEGEGYEAKQEEGEEAEGEEEQEASFQLFDGSEESLQKWRSVGYANCEFQDGVFCIQAGKERGLVYFQPKRYSDFKLKLRYCPESEDFDARAAVRFLDPTQEVPDRDDPNVRYPYDNQAYVASHTGFEVYIGPKQAGQEPGTFPDVLIGDAPGAQLHPERAEVKTDDWNELEITVEGDCYAVRLNGKETARFANTDSYRGKPSSAASEAGYVGIVTRKGALRIQSFEVEEIETAGEQEEAGGESSPEPG